MTIYDKCTTVGSYAFSQCAALSTITLGKGISVIGTYAFSSCSIKKINIYSSTPPDIVGVMFNSNSESLYSITLNVPLKAVDAYKAADVWKNMSVKAMENDLRTFTLSVSSADESMGTTTPGGDFDEDSEVLIYAAAKDGYKFSRWNDGNTDNPRTVKMIGNLSYKAYYIMAGNNQSGCNGDVNKDGTVDIADVVAVYNIMAGGRLANVYRHTKEE